MPKSSIASVRPILAGALMFALSGCATRSDIRTLQAQMLEQHRITSEMLAALDVAQDSADARRSAESVAVQDNIANLSGQVQSGLTAIEGSLVRLGELSGQGYQSLQEIREEVAKRPIPAAVAAPEAPEPSVADSVPNVEVAAYASRPPCPAPAEAEPILRTLRELVRQKTPAISTAREGAREYIRCFHQGPGAVEAKLLYAETYVLEGDITGAHAAFGALVTQHPASPLAPTALFRQGIVEMERQSLPAARGYFEMVKSRYPASQEATLAEASLRKMPR